MCCAITALGQFAITACSASGRDYYGEDPSKPQTRPLTLDPNAQDDPRNWSNGVPPWKRDPEYPEIYKKGK